MSAQYDRPPDRAWRSKCPISTGLDVLGDKWSLLIVRDLAVYQTRTFSDFRESSEGIASNILSTRLKRLTGLGLIERCDPERSARGNAYRLTERVAALMPTLDEFFQWAQTHLIDMHPDMHRDRRSFTQS